MGLGLLVSASGCFAPGREGSGGEDTGGTSPVGGQGRGPVSFGSSVAASLSTMVGCNLEQHERGTATQSLVTSTQRDLPKAAYSKEIIIHRTKPNTGKVGVQKH